MKSKKIALIGILGALSALLMYFKFPLPFMPPFMDFDLCGVPEMIGGFALGPVAAISIVFIKLILKLALQGTSTMFVGELSNFILSCAYVLPAIYIYHKNKTKKGAIHGLALGTIIVACTAIFTNLYIIIPFYGKMLGMEFQTILDMCAAVNPMVNNAITLAIFGIVPFNLIKNGAVSIITILLYKKISRIIKNYVK